MYAGIYSIGVLKISGSIREKSLLVKKKPASGAAGGKRKIWCHMNSLEFLNYIITGNYREDNNYL